MEQVLVLSMCALNLTSRKDWEQKQNQHENIGVVVSVCKASTWEAMPGGVR